MRVIIEVREKGNNYTVAEDAKAHFMWDPTDAEKRAAIISAANAALRTLRLSEIEAAE